MTESLDSRTIISGDETPEYQPIACNVNGWNNSAGCWSIDAVSMDGLLHFTSSKRSSAKAVDEVKDILQGNNGLKHPERLVGIRKGALVISRNHVADLACAFLEFQSTLNNARNTCANYSLADELEAVYLKYFSGKRFRLGKAKQLPQFDVNVYPSLFLELPLLQAGQGIQDQGLPAAWTSTELSRHPQLHEPLVAMLLAFIWKQGDFQKVAHVLKGLRGTALKQTDSVVLYQFGRHLATPLEEPIFDQHSARAQWLLTKGISQWQAANELTKHLETEPRAKTLFGESRGQLRSDDLKNYLNWWTEIVKPTLPDADVARIAAIQWIDRLMFCLGKAAVLVLQPP